MMRAMSVGFCGLLCLVLSGCANGGGPAQQVIDTTNTAEKTAIDANVQSLQMGASSYSAANAGETAQGFNNYVGTGTNCRNAAGEAIQCQVAAPHASDNSGKVCSVSSTTINCNGVFRYYDPVVYRFSGGNVTVDATLKPYRQ